MLKIKVCARASSVQKVSSQVLWKTETFIIENIRYKKHCTQDNDTSVPFKVGTLGPHKFSQSPSAALLYFPESHQKSEISSVPKVILLLGKPRSNRTPNLGCRGVITWVIWCFAEKLCTRHDAWAGVLLWWSCQSPVAHGCGLLNQLNSFRGGIFKLNTKSDAESLLYSVILNVMATQYTCSLNGIYCAHWLVL